MTSSVTVLYVLLMASTFLIAWFIALHTVVFRNRNLINLLFASLSFITGFWPLANLLVIVFYQLTGSIEQTFFIVKPLSFLSVSFYTPVLFFLTLSLGGERRFFKRWYPPVIFLIPPVLDYFLALTNEYHHLLYRSVSLNEEAPFPAPLLESGPLHSVHLIILVFYFGMTAAYFITLYMKFRRGGLELQQPVKALLIGFSLCLAVGLVQIAELLPFMRYWNITPHIQILAVLLVGLALFKTKLSSFLPAAREYILDNLIEGFIVLNLDRKIVDINPRAKQWIFGTRTDNLTDFKDATEQDFFALLEKEGHLKPYAEHIRTLEGALQDIASGNIIAKDFEVEVLHPLQPRREWVAVKVRPVKDPDESEERQIFGFVVFLENITAEREARFVDERASRLKSVLLAMLSHDLKNALNVINGSADLALNALDLEKQRINLTRVKKKSIETAEAINSVLNFLKVSDLAISNSIRPIDILETVRMALNRLEENIKAKNLTMVLDRPEGEEQGYFTLANLALDSVFYNLLDNAVKFSPREGAIEITIKKSGRYWLVCIADNGTGVPQDLREEIFMPFRKFGDPERTGTGLGLAMVKEAVEIFKGQVSVENNTPTGAKFFCKLPAYIE